MFLNHCDCIYDRQFGFQSGDSTMGARVNLTEGIRNALDNN